MSVMLVNYNQFIASGCTPTDLCLWYDVRRHLYCLSAVLGHLPEAGSVHHPHLGSVLGFGLVYGGADGVTWNEETDEACCAPPSELLSDLLLLHPPHCAVRHLHCHLGHLPEGCQRGGAAVPQEDSSIMIPALISHTLQYVQQGSCTAPARGGVHDMIP
eukprot:1146828-Pelagomonas_calceolata.AAC.1